jgi:hypothetical protein
MHSVQKATRECQAGTKNSSEMAMYISPVIGFLSFNVLCGMHFIFCLILVEEIYGLR